MVFIRRWHIKTLFHERAVLSRSNYFPWNNNKDRLLYLKTRDSIYLNTFSGIETEEKKKYLQALYETSIYELDTELEKFFDYLEKKQRKLITNNCIQPLSKERPNKYTEMRMSLI